MTYTLIATEQELATICQSISTEQYIAVDTEFKRETSYFPIPCLVQICTSSTTYCIDLLAIKELNALEMIFFNQHIVKVFHSGRQDLELFYCMFGRVPEPVFDTQIAAGLLGHDDQLGYANLVKQELQVELDKSQTRTDWEKRPFTKRQLDYAANDVIYLRKLYEKQVAQLQSLNRSTWCEEDCKQLTETSLYQPEVEDAWKKIKSFHRLTSSQQCIAYEIAKWRESEAIKRNKTRNYLLKNAALLELACKTPRSIDQLTNIADINKATIRRYGETLLEILSHTSSMSEKDCPTAKNYFRLTDEQFTLLEQLLNIVKEKSTAIAINSCIICSKKELEKIVRGKRDSNLFSGWRYQLAGKEIETILQTKTTINN